MNIIGNVHNATFTPVNANYARSVYARFEGKRVDISVKEYKAKRSLPQNDFYWLTLTVIAQWSMDAGNAHHTPMFMHEKFKILFNSVMDADEATGEVICVPQSTTKLNVSEFAQYFQKIRNWAIDCFDGIKLPEKDEH